MTRPNPCLDALQDEVTNLDDDMVELSLLLPGWQAEALAVEAHDRGLTPAQMLRRLVRDFFASRDTRVMPGPIGPIKWA